MSIFIVLFFILLSTSSSVSSQNATAYEVLEKYKLPRGILPQGVKDYDLNIKNGHFKVHFNTTCQFPIDSYKVKYASTISGIIRTRKVRELKGVSVKVLFFWLNVEEVTREDEDQDLDFSFGIGSEEAPVSDFVESPKCGCGFYCDLGSFPLKAHHSSRKFINPL